MENVNVKIGERVIPISVRRPHNAKRISLRISQAKNSVVLTLPKRASLLSGMKFLDSKSDWLLTNLEENPAITIYDGATLPILGKLYTIKRLNGRGVTQLDTENLQIVVHCQEEFITRRVKDFLKKFLQEECTKRAEHLAFALNKHIKKVIISEAMSRWGSCKKDGTLSFSSLLIFAPPEILQYIIAHEVAHLKEMNHSPHFWKVVEQLYPDMHCARKWLRKEGYRLHRYP